eukprot:tig00000189_g14336.t1
MEPWTTDFLTLPRVAVSGSEAIVSMQLRDRFGNPVDAPPWQAAFGFDEAPGTLSVVSADGTSTSVPVRFVSDPLTGLLEATFVTSVTGTARLDFALRARPGAPPLHVGTRPVLNWLPAPAPTVVLAEMTSSLIAVRFSADTNAGRMQLGQRYPADALFDPASASLLKGEVIWKDRSLLHVLLSASSAVVPGRAVLRFQPGKVRTALENSISMDSAFNLFVAPSIAPPVAVITGPSKFSGCSDISFSGALSYGSNNRPMIYHWSARSENATAQQAASLVLDPQASQQSVALRAAQIATLPAGVYELSLTVSTSWGMQSTTSLRVEKIDLPDDDNGTNVHVTSIAILAPRVLRVRGAGSLALRAEVYSCRSDAADFAWQASGLATANDSEAAASSAGAGQRAFLQARALPRGGNATVAVAASRNGTVVAEDRITLIAVPSRIVALTSPRGLIVARAGSSEPLVVDASLSFDPDEPEAGSAGLLFEWTIEIPGSALQRVSGAPALPADIRLAVVVSKPSKRAWSLAASGAAASVLVSIRAKDEPALNVQVLSAQPHATTDVLRIAASLSLSSGGALNNSEAAFSWSVSPASSQSASGSILRPENLLSRPGSPVLLLKPGVLDAGMLYTFTVTARNRSGPVFDSASASVECASHPSMGRLVLSVQDGILVAAMADWTDAPDRLPLSYSFGVVSPVTGTDIFVSVGQALPSLSISGAFARCLAYPCNLTCFGELNATLAIAKLNSNSTASNSNSNANASSDSALLLSEALAGNFDPVEMIQKVAELALLDSGAPNVPLIDVLRALNASASLIERLGSDAYGRFSALAFLSLRSRLESAASNSTAGTGAEGSAATADALEVLLAFLRLKPLGTASEDALLTLQTILSSSSSSSSSPLRRSRGRGLRTETGGLSRAAVEASLQSLALGSALQCGQQPVALGSLSTTSSMAFVRVCQWAIDDGSVAASDLQLATPAKAALQSAVLAVGTPYLAAIRASPSDQILQVAAFAPGQLPAASHPPQSLLVSGEISLASHEVLSSSELRSSSLASGTASASTSQPLATLRIGCETASLAAPTGMFFSGFACAALGSNGGAGTSAWTLTSNATRGSAGACSAAAPLVCDLFELPTTVAVLGLLTPLPSATPSPSAPLSPTPTAAPGGDAPTPSAQPTPASPPSAEPTSPPDPEQTPAPQGPAPGGSLTVVAPSPSTAPLSPAAVDPAPGTGAGVGTGTDDPRPESPADTTQGSRRAAPQETGASGSASPAGIAAGVAVGIAVLAVVAGLAGYRYRAMSLRAAEASRAAFGPELANPDPAVDVYEGGTAGPGPDSSVSPRRAPSINSPSFTLGGEAAASPAGLAIAPPEPALLDGPAASAVAPPSLHPGGAASEARHKLIPIVI